MIRAKASAPELCPKSKPGDVQKLKDIYRCIDKRLAGVEEDLKKYGIERMIIKIACDEAVDEEPANVEVQKEE